MSEIKAFCIGVIVTCSIINLIVLFMKMNKGEDDD